MPFSATFLHLPRREVHACACYGPYCFGGLRSFINNPLLLKSWAKTMRVLHICHRKLKERLVIMVCLFMKDVNWIFFVFKFLSEVKMCWNFREKFLSMDSFLRPQKGRNVDLMGCGSLLEMPWISQFLAGKRILSDLYMDWEQDFFKLTCYIKGTPTLLFEVLLT